MEDEKIIDLYLLRDEQAIAETGKKYGIRLRAVSKKIIGDDNTVEECENDTYLAAWNSIPPKEPRHHFYAFLLKIIRNISINRLRDKKSNKRNFTLIELSKEMENCLPCVSDTTQEVDAKFMGEIISNFLKKQPETKRNIFIRRYFFTDSIGDIAARFNIGESKVKTILFRMRNELKEHLEKEGYTV